MSRHQLYCSDFGDTQFCCSSCHEDADEGYFELIDIELADNYLAFVCCAVANRAGVDGLTTQEWLEARINKEAKEHINE